MKLARYWTRAQAETIGPNGKKVSAWARGWSDDSLDAARTRAREIAQRVAERIASQRTEKQRYPYGDRPLPEPVIREFRGTGDDPSGVVTRNAYGALVLNANQLMFVDVDSQEGQKTGASSLGKVISSLFKKPDPQPDPKVSDHILEFVSGVAQRHGLAARVYQTAAGFRLLITSSPFEAGSPEAEALLNEFGSDPLYVRLCRQQECFRARLTPKPWRCRMQAPPVEFPFETPAAQNRFDRWEADYRSRTASYATCSFIGTVGTVAIVSHFDELIHYHDQETKTETTLPLA